MKKQYQAIASACYRESAEFRAREGVEYAWVWDYAIHRYGWVVERKGKVELKALQLLRTLAGLATAVWAVLGVLYKAAGVTDTGAVFWPFWLGGAAGLLLVTSIVFCILALLPGDVIQPHSETLALQVGEFSASVEEAKAKFALGFAAATESLFDWTDVKSQLLLVAFWLLAAGVLLMVASVLLALLGIQPLR